MCQNCPKTLSTSPVMVCPSRSRGRQTLKSCDFASSNRIAFCFSALSPKPICCLIVSRSARHPESHAPPGAAARRRQSSGRASQMERPGCDASEVKASNLFVHTTRVSTRREAGFPASARGRTNRQRASAYRRFRWLPHLLNETGIHRSSIQSNELRSACCLPCHGYDFMLSHQESLASGCCNGEGPPVIVCLSKFELPPLRPVRTAFMEYDLRALRGREYE